MGHRDAAEGNDQACERQLVRINLLLMLHLAKVAQKFGAGEGTDLRYNPPIGRRLPAEQQLEGRQACSDHNPAAAGGRL